MTRVRTASLRFLPPTLAFALVVAFVPGRASLALRVYALVVSAIALVLAVAALHRAFPAAPAHRPRASEPQPRRQPPPSLTQLESEAILGVSSAFYLHHRLVPRIRALTAELLVARRGLSLDDEPDKARTVLGAATWELVRNDRPPPTDRVAHGIPPDALARVVESLERI